MKAKSELMLYHLFWLADYAMRPSMSRIGESFEEWAYHRGFLRQVRELERQGMLEAAVAMEVDTGRVIRLTEQGILRAVGGCDPVARWDRPWDGQWRMVVFDLPETRRKLRSQLRRQLLAAGFGCLQGSVWITPEPFGSLREALGKHDVAGGTLVFFSGRPCGGESDADLVNAAWRMDAVHGAYESLRAHLKTLPASMSREQLLEWGNTERRLWDACMKLDPMLPRTLWPLDYPGEQVWQERLATLKAAGKLAWQS